MVMEKTKISARLKVRNALRSGMLTRKPCEQCGKKKVDAHHDDYRKPLKVRWLCHVHHRQHHARMEAAS